MLFLRRSVNWELSSLEAIESIIRPGVEEEEQPVLKRLHPSARENATLWDLPNSRGSTTPGNPQERYGTWLNDRRPRREANKRVREQQSIPAVIYISSTRSNRFVHMTMFPKCFLHIISGLMWLLCDSESRRRSAPDCNLFQDLC